MPIYEYECKKCGNLTEAFQKFSDAPLAECELCHGDLKKLISQNSFHLKGSGWYVTDYASKKAANSKGNERKTSKAENKSPKIEAKSSTESSSKKDSSSPKAASKK